MYILFEETIQRQHFNLFEQLMLNLKLSVF